MGKISLLDCTLRDGGYINDWRFGNQAILDITHHLKQTNINILELGFLKNEPYQPDRTVFNSAFQLSNIIGQKKEGQLYAAMIEVISPLPIEQLEAAENSDIDIIRVIVWKRMLKEGFEYCKGIVEKGYRLCVQPARVDQYSKEEFVEMLHLFSTLNPLAIYVVDSWGTQNNTSLLEYMTLADSHMPPHISLGYHGHNNLMQAYQVAVDLIELGFERDIIIDASIYGIGRGAGNLNLELISLYMNRTYETNYNISPMLYIYDQYLKAIFQKEAWGYSMAHYLTAIYNCNPNFGAYYSRDKQRTSTDIEGILRLIPKDERIIFSSDKADKYESEYDCIKKGL